MKSLRVRWDDVICLLMDGLSLRMYRASRMDNRYGSLLVQIILVLLNRDSRVRLILWEFWVCCFEPPLLRCMVNRRERVIVVSPMYVWLWSSLVRYLPCVCRPIYSFLSLETNIFFQHIYLISYVHMLRTKNTYSIRNWNEQRTEITSLDCSFHGDIPLNVKTIIHKEMKLFGNYLFSIWFVILYSKIISLWYYT